MTKCVRVLLADDHAVVRTGYRTLLEQCPDVKVVAEAASGELACRLYAESLPDVVIMDISLPGLSGLDATRRILKRNANARVLMFSMHEEAVFAEQALQSGALGYLTKSSAPEVLVEAVRMVGSGKLYLEHALAQRLALKRFDGRENLLDRLSPREFEIFRLLAAGLDVAEAARRMSLSQKTVANYSTQVKVKLKARTVAELARIAIRHGIIDA